MSKQVCKYVMRIHRSSDIEGVFILTDGELKILKDMDGSSIDYGEVAGKHSEVVRDLYFSDIEVIREKPEEVEFFEKLFPEGVGFDFKNYWFNTSSAEEAGYDAAVYGSYKDANEALEDEGSRWKGIMKEAFIEGFNDGRNQKKNV